MKGLVIYASTPAFIRSILFCRCFGCQYNDGDMAGHNRFLQVAAEAVAIHDRIIRSEMMRSGLLLGNFRPLSVVGHNDVVVIRSMVVR